jgi:Uma2 family endonuclease
MSAGLMPPPMTVDEFLVWADGHDGKWELHDGDVVAMAPERARHSLVKAYAISALVHAVRRAGAPCGVYADGLVVRVGGHRAFRPDAVVVCPAAPSDAKDTSTPLIALEVLSPSTAAADHGLKREGYFALPSLMHYLILDPDRRALACHQREGSGRVASRILHAGSLRLEPPGIELEIEELFGPAD